MDMNEHRFEKVDMHDCLSFSSEDANEANELYKQLTENRWKFAWEINNYTNREYSGFLNEEENTFIFWVGNLEVGEIRLCFKNVFPDYINGRYTGGDPDDLEKIFKIIKMDFNFALECAIKSELTSKYIRLYGMSEWTTEQINEFNDEVKKEFNFRKKEY